MKFIKRLTPITILLYFVCIVLLFAAARFTIQFFATNAIFKMVIAIVLIGMGWYAGALATINLRPKDNED